eukprot:gene25533-biopygen18010
MPASLMNAIRHGAPAPGGEGARVPHDGWALTPGLSIGRKAHTPIVDSITQPSGHALARSRSTMLSLDLGLPHARRSGGNAQHSRAPCRSGQGENAWHGRSRCRPSGGGGGRRQGVDAR